MPTRTRVLGDDRAWDVHKVGSRDAHGATLARETRRPREARWPGVPHQWLRLGQTGRQVIEMRADGLEGGGNGGAVELCNPVEKQCQFRSDVLFGAQSAMRRASLECFTP